MKYFIVTFFIFTLISCTKKNQSPPDTLVIGIATAPQTLDPRFGTDAASGNMAGLLFSSLVRMDGDMNIVPELAESWTYKNLIYEFQLRPNVRFSNGDSLTRDDLLFSFQEFQKDSCPYSSAFKKIKKVEAQYNESERYVRVHLEEFSTSTLTDLTLLKILPRKVVETHGKDFYAHIVGSGGYEVKSMSDNEIYLEYRSEHYQESKIKKILFKIVRDDNSRFQRMYKGGLDIVQADMPLSKVHVFKTSPRFEVFVGPGLHVTYLLVNLRDPFLKNLDVRKAIAQSIDRDSIIKYKLEGYATPAYTFVPPLSPFFEAGLQLPPYDEVAAKQSLAPHLKQHPTLELKTSNQASAVENGRILAHQFEKLGLDVKLKSFEWGTYYDDIKKGQFQLATMRFVGVTDPDIYRLAFHSQELPPVGKNRGFYINKSLDRLLDEGTRIEDMKKRIAHYQQIQRIVLQDLPAIPLWYDQYVTIVNKKIKNYRFTPNNSFAFVYYIEKINEKDQ